MNTKRRTFLFAIFSSLGGKGFLFGAPHADTLKLTIQSVTKSEDPKKPAIIVKATLMNSTDQDFSLWAANSTRGRRMFRFAFIDPSGAHICVDRFLAPIVTGPEGQADWLKSGKQLEYEFDLFDGTWNWPSYIGIGSADRLVAYLDNPESQRAPNLWIGHLESSPAALQGTLKNYAPGFVELPPGRPPKRR